MIIMNKDLVYYTEKENHQRNKNRGFINEVKVDSINDHSVNPSWQLDSKSIEKNKTKVRNKFGILQQLQKRLWWKYNQTLPSN